MLTAAVFQDIAAALSAITALLGLGVAVRNYPRLTNWLKSRETLISERDAAERRIQEAVEHAKEARQSVADVRTSLDAVRAMYGTVSARLEQLEEMRPIYDAALTWTPRAFEYVSWLERVARRNNLDLGGRQMPELPAVLVDYFARDLGTRG